MSTSIDNKLRDACEIVWRCPMQANNNDSKEKFYYIG